MPDIKLAALLSFVLILIPKFCSSQPFSHLVIGGSLQDVSFLNEKYSSNWTLTNGYSISAHTPFYVGTIGLQVNKYNYRTIANQIRAFNFRSVNYSVDFGYRLRINNYFYVFGAIGTGIQKLTNRYKRPNGYLYTDERELFFLAKFEPQADFKYFILFGNIEYRNVLNYYRQQLLFIEGGVRLRFSLPKKLQEFIK
ncbi:hypothetical protein [Gracilimonas sp. BCB1]|uniref:hypothetical protein n=1 Tax=Gracilimonas sp. BCB1 TaxID=3152362 RepID=UPI0032D8C02A